MMPEKIPLIFFESQAGNEPVLDWLKSLPRADRQAIGQDLMRVQWRWPVGMPLCRSLKNGLWEVRSTLPGGRIASVIFCAHHGELAALHGFIEKSQRTPKDDLDLALKRIKELDP
jgi:phage-related protein